MVPKLNDFPLYFGQEPEPVGYDISSLCDRVAVHGLVDVSNGDPARNLMAETGICRVFLGPPPKWTAPSDPRRLEGTIWLVLEERGRRLLIPRSRQLLRSRE